MNERIREEIDDINSEALSLDGLDGDKFAFDDAIIGIAERCGMDSVLAYDEDKIIDILMEKYDMDGSEAQEWYSYNMVGAYVGEGTPIFVKMSSNIL